MAPWSRILAEALGDLTVPVVIGLAVTVPLLRGFAKERRRVRGLVVLAALHLALVPLAAFADRIGPNLQRDLRLACLAFAALALVGMVATTLFAVVLPRLRLDVPKILQDVLMAVASVVSLFAVASRVGLDLSGLLTTSAILTAVVGLALQDTLGNVVGGLALQTDRSIRVGDWIAVGAVSGRVTEIRWRYTAVETRDWETVFVPNSALLKSQVTVVGRRDGGPIRWRRHVSFNVDFRFAPSHVIRVVDEALRSVPIERVAASPEPRCLLLDLRESLGRYEVRYWLTDPEVEEGTDSVIRNRIVFALRRAEIPLAMPAQAVFVTEESQERKADKASAELARRREALERVDLFRVLSDADRARLAEGLRYVPFTAGEAITRQGAEAHWLYLLVAGEVSVRIHGEGGERELRRIAAGSFFGEMSLLTGAPRSATVVALTDAECYRLDKDAFQAIMRERPELAESVAELLAKRQVELEALRSNLDRAAEPRELADTKNDLLARIRSFFALDDEGRKAG